MQTDSLVNKFFKVGNTVRIEYNDETGKVTTFQGVIKLFKDDELRLGLLTEISSDKIPKNSKLFLVFNNNGTDYYFTATVYEIVNNKQTILTTNQPKPADISSLRRFFRCDVHLELIYSFRGKEVQGWIKNLSACGLLAICRTNPELKVGFIMECQFQIPTLQEVIHVKGQLVRVEPALDAKQLIAVNFFDISERHQSAVIKYLFQRQREIAQKVK
ncbi:MAG TPA: PilZ domain-containing protein [Bacillota bacterium]|nr:PilZ domain-containing protein [Bacillota bacterium]HOL09491.1 PilZ domain-containing protein [Bacillota bacterium]HPO97547.1 PilZ domain-containing protein [Bacillota bacterium]